MANLVFQFRTFCQNSFVGCPVVFLGHTGERRPILPIVVGRIFRQVVKKGSELIKVLPRDWVKLVIVTNRTARRETEERRAECLSSFALVVHSQLFDESAAFAGTDAGTQKR